ncbi:hypothetical protein [Pedobacter jamesrossensis]|uniref:Uncharacterized protein n=1 Tax=Pedobacter jamesrossensis TaxID=1908238 RepID=A0ABV8NPN8_9SPHI
MKDFVELDEHIAMKSFDGMRLSWADPQINEFWYKNSTSEFFHRLAFCYVDQISSDYVDL